jgi:drug/metabolite transporter (DMT)-like permease
MWLLYAIFASMLWGLNYSLNERVFEKEISPATLLVFQALTGMLIAGLVGFHDISADLKTVRADRATLLLAVAALFSYGLGNLLISLSIQAKNATLAGLVELSYPIFTVLFSYLLFKKWHLSPMGMVGGVLIMVGLVLVALSDKTSA